MYEEAQRHSRIRTGVSYVLSFLLFFLLVCFSLCVLIQETALNENFLQSQVAQSGYSGYALSAVQDEVVSYGLASGFDQGFCRSLISKDRVSADVSKLVSSIYQKNVGGPDYDTLQKEFYKKFVENAQSRKIAVSGKSESALQLLAKTFAQSYRNHVSLPATVVSAMRAAVPKIVKAVLILEILSLALAFIVLGFLFKLNHRRSFFRYCIYAFSGATVIFAATGTVALASGQIEKVGIVEQSFYVLTVSYAHHMVIALFLAAACLVAVTAAFAAAYVVRCKKHKEVVDAQHAKGVYRKKLIN